MEGGGEKVSEDRKSGQETDEETAFLQQRDGVSEGALELHGASLSAGVYVERVLL